MMNNIKGKATNKNMHWGNGFTIGSKTKYHPYTHKKFDFNKMRNQTIQEEIIN